jgi:hypothetical protein
MVSDTHPLAKRFQIELLRRATVSERLARMRSLTATTINLSRRAIASANPRLTPRQIDLKCVELYYGRELARRLSDYLGSE